MILDSRFSIALVLSTMFAPQESDAWRLVYRAGREGEMLEYKSVLMDGTGLRDESNDRAARAGRSPDGKRRLYVFKPGDTSQICTSDMDDRNETKITDGKALDLYPSWTPDGKRIVFQSNRSGKPQVWIMDADGQNPTKLTDHSDGATQPVASPTSEVIVYREEHAAPRQKLPPSTLRIMDFSSRNSKVILEKTEMLGHSWSPKGDWLAVSLIQELRILEMPAAKVVKSCKFEDISKDLYAHAAYNMVWRPDGKAIACTIHFLGGRIEGTKIFGDEQVFILPFEGKPVVIEAGGPASPVRWIR